MRAFQQCRSQAEPFRARLRLAHSVVAGRVVGAPLGERAFELFAVLLSERTTNILKLRAQLGVARLRAILWSLCCLGFWGALAHHAFVVAASEVKAVAAVAWIQLAVCRVAVQLLKLAQALSSSCWCGLMRLGSWRWHWRATSVQKKCRKAVQARTIGCGERLRLLGAKVRPWGSSKRTLSWRRLARLADVSAARVGEDVFFVHVDRCACHRSGDLVWRHGISVKQLQGDAANKAHLQRMRGCWLGRLLLTAKLFAGQARVCAAKPPKSLTSAKQQRRIRSAQNGISGIRILRCPGTEQGRRQLAPGCVQLFEALSSGAVQAMQLLVYAPRGRIKTLRDLEQGGRRRQRRGGVALLAT